MSKEAKSSRRDFIVKTGIATGAFIVGGVVGFMVKSPETLTETITKTVASTTTSTTTTTVTGMTTTTIPTTTSTTTTTTITTTPPPESKLVMALGEEVLNLDPARAASVNWASNYATAAVYDQLVVWGRVPYSDYPGHFIFDKLQGDTPQIAEKIEWAPDRTYIDIWIRSDAKFNDGSPITADDIKYTMDRAAKVPEAKTMVDRLRYDHTEVMDGGKRARIVFKGATPLAALILPFKHWNPLNSKLVQSHATEKDPTANDWVGANPSGAGPYLVDKWTPGVQLVLKRNPNYWGTPPKTETIIIRFIPNSSDRLLLLKEGTVDIGDPFLLRSELKSLETDPNITIYKAPSATWEPININHKIPPFGEKTVRQALAYAIPYDTIIDKVLYGYGIRLKSPVPKGIDTHTEEFWKYEYDLDKAKALLAQTSVPNGFDCEAVYPEGKIYQRDIFTWIQNEWKKIGVNLTVRAMPDAALADARTKGTAPMHMWVYSPFARDPFYIFDAWYRKHVLGQWPLCIWWSGPGNDRVVELTQQYMSSFDAQARLQASREIQQIIVDEVPYFLIYQWVWALPMRKNVKGFSYDPDEHVGRHLRYMYKE